MGSICPSGKGADAHRLSQGYASAKGEKQERAKNTRGEKLTDAHRQNEIKIRIGDAVNKNQKNGNQKSVEKNIWQGEQENAKSKTRNTSHTATESRGKKGNETAEDNVKRMSAAKKRGQKAAHKKSWNSRPRKRGKNGKSFGEAQLDRSLVKSKGIRKQGKRGIKRRDHGGKGQVFRFFGNFHAIKKGKGRPANLLSFVLREDRISNSRYEKERIKKHSSRNSAKKRKAQLRKAGFSFISFG